MKEKRRTEQNSKGMSERIKEAVSEGMKEEMEGRNGYENSEET